jgi:hypothetical protein
MVGRGIKGEKGLPRGPVEMSGGVNWPANMGKTSGKHREHIGKMNDDDGSL